jgi:type IX secretion system substrate protein
MKNLYFKLAAFILLPCALSAQVISTNSNWYAGDYAGVTFLTNPPTALTDTGYGSPLNGMNTIEGCATVSNSNGQLLFYTNGTSVWNRNHAIMSNSASPNGLTGSYSSAQSAVIVPSLSNRNQYYVFTVGGAAHAYSIVDMSLDSGLGDVSSTVKNVELLNELGNSLSGTCIEALTACKNDDQTGYWVLIPNGNRLHAYLVDASGVATVPVVSNLSFSLTPYPAEHSIGFIKASPNSDKVTVGYFTSATNPASDVGQLKVYSFNNATGALTSDYLLTIDHLGTYGMEFSPDGSILYASQGLDHDPAQLVIIDLATGNYRTETVAYPYYISSIQRGPDDEMYIPGATYLHKIVNQNSYSTATLSYNVIDLNPSVQLPGGPTNRIADLCLPQLVQNLHPCIDLVLDAPETSTPYLYKHAKITTQKNTSASTSYSISSGKDITFRAEMIELMPDTHVASGSIFLGKVEDCGINPNLRPGNGTSFNKTVDFKLTPDVLKVYPNPASDFAEIRLQGNTFGKVSITSMDGKLIFEKAVNRESSIKVDISGYINGLYIVTVETTDGGVLSEKIIKQ